jgi:ferredoxin-NADP reductase/MOSC domain-containing protein YiiM/ferredoxin
VGTLDSVNVGLPKNVAWNDKMVYTAIWKAPVDGPVMARRLNLDGDKQGDLASHGGEHRAVMVYQSESYRFWEDYLHRDDLQPGAFGENFTVTGLADQEVCIGDRYRIGDAEFEVTQPRVTCYRVGLRLNQPDMAKLLVSQHRPGFYLRVLKEGQVRAGDDIVLMHRGPHELSVADVDALMYLPDRDVDQLRLIVGVPALSRGWATTFEKLLAEHEGAPGRSAPSIGVEPGWNGFRSLRVSEIHQESPQVLSIRLTAEDDSALPRPLPGQYLTVRTPGEPAPMRSYSLSGDPGAGDYRISVKREDHGAVSGWLHDHVEPGSVLQIAAPRGEFCLTDGDSPVVLASAGIGVTPVLAMLYALSAAHAGRDIWWLHTVRNPESQAFGAEVEALIASLPRAHRHVFYTQTQGRLDRTKIAALKLPTDAVVYLCGPSQFMADMTDALVAAGLSPRSIRSESFGALAAINPGVVDQGPRTPPHQPPGPPGTGPAITFARSALTAGWSTAYPNILEFAEACDVPTRFACRTGVCPGCETGVVEGGFTYVQAPLEPPGPGTVLICSATPAGDLVLDL